MGITHFDQARQREFEIGHLAGRWTFLGEAAGSLKVGLRRIEVPAGRWSTPAHEHGSEEEIFYVLGGNGLAWLAGKTAAIAAGDCVVFPPRTGDHTIHALEHLDLLAFGARAHDESPRFPRLGLSLVGNRAVDSLDALSDGVPIQFARERELGAPELPPVPGPRPETIVNLRDVAPDQLQRPRVQRTRRNLGRVACCTDTGLQHVEVAAGMQSSPQHCHSVEEEIFVILDGAGKLLLDDQAIDVRGGHVIARPGGSGEAHTFLAGEEGLTYLAYGTRDPSDVCYYPRSNKVAFRGIGVIARLEELGYWDGED